MASSETSILDTLATLATASTQMATAVSDSNQQAHKVASIPNQAVVAPSYVTIPGIPGPVSIIQANPNQPGLVQQVASALPPGMIQLASPLAFNILPGGRIQVFFIQSSFIHSFIFTFIQALFIPSFMHYSILIFI